MPFIAKEIAAMVVVNHYKILLNAKEEVSFESMIIHVGLSLWYLWGSK